MLTVPKQYYGIADSSDAMRLANDYANLQTWRFSNKCTLEQCCGVIYDDFSRAEVPLAPHQRTGCLFVCRAILGLRDNRCRGALLADRQGFGKTRTSIAAMNVLTLLYRQNTTKQLKFIVACTATLKTVWRNELQEANFADMTVEICSHEGLAKVQRDRDTAIIVDEAHKCLSTKRYNLIRAGGFVFRLLLTGTPVQNSSFELGRLLTLLHITDVAPEVALQQRDSIMLRRDNVADYIF